MTIKSIKLPSLFLTFVLLITIFGCGKNDSSPSFKADFSYEMTDGNHAQFTNKSEGEYYSLIWNFGNGTGDTTTDKKQSYQVYYPLAGAFEASLRLTDYTGNNQTVSKTINIATSDLEVSFIAEIEPANPNYVNLKNTTTGEFDSFKWFYRTEVIENESEHTAYFPFSGSYVIELQVFKNNISFSLKKTIVISQDDPNYIPNLTLTWADEFDGSAVNTDFWTFETGSSGWGNNELQNYTNQNTEVVNGKLIITAKKVNESTTVGSYTSSRIVTKAKKEFKYGKIEIRAKLPSGTGIWPAIWMLGSNFNTAGWPACGEMDIMEYVGYEPNVVHSTVHTTSGSGGNGSGNSMNLTSCEEEFHIYGLLWTEEKLTFYVDTPDNIVHTYNPAVKTAENWPFNQTAFFILNVAVGGNWGGAQGIDNSIFPQSMEIDYVHVYQESKK
jgi:beta-glucanase (GH16 family)